MPLKDSEDVIVTTVAKNGAPTKIEPKVEKMRKHSDGVDSTGSQNRKSILNKFSWGNITDVGVTEKDD